MRLAITTAALAALSLFGCADPHAQPRLYARNDLQLLTSYAAKEICTCVFVMHQTDAFCERFTRASPNLKTFRIDHEGKTVETAAVLFWSARARWVSPRFGCVLE